MLAYLGVLLLKLMMLKLLTARSNSVTILFLTISLFLMLLKISFLRCYKKILGIDLL